MSGCVLTTSHVLPFRPIWLHQARGILQRVPHANLGLGACREHIRFAPILLVKHPTGPEGAKCVIPVFRNGFQLAPKEVLRIRRGRPFVGTHSDQTNKPLVDTVWLTCFQCMRHIRLAQACPIHGVRSFARWHGCDDNGGVFRLAGRAPRK